MKQYGLVECINHYTFIDNISFFFFEKGEIYKFYRKTNDKNIFVYKYEEYKNCGARVENYEYHFRIIPIHEIRKMKLEKIWKD